MDSHTYHGKYLPEKIYLDQSKAALTQDEKLAVFEIFCQYERWKARVRAYDFMDLVNYVLGQLRFKKYREISLHYLQIDEIQDLPKAVIMLLCQVVEQGIFFSGDTAQTISKGVNFRFSDIREMFKGGELHLEQPTLMQLTVNFRSHNSILQLANSLVSALEQFFPKTIDRLKKERSNLVGPKPLLIDHNDVDVLFMLLSEDAKQSPESLDIAARPKLEFGCDQVIIVRDQAEKENIPKMLQHALCLTVYEAKGLEFEDVILFNFFSSCPIDDRWTLLKHLAVTEEEMDLDVFLASVSRVAKEEDEDSLGGIRQEGKRVFVHKIKADSKALAINEFSELATELKLLYTAVTRPRNTLIIYDQQLEKRKLIEQYWEKLALVDKISLRGLASEELAHEGHNELKGRLMKAKKTSKEAWKAQGVKMFKRKYFEQAIKCFENAEEERLLEKAGAYLIAEEASSLFIEAETERKTLHALRKAEASQAKRRIKECSAKAVQQFGRAAAIFERLGLLKEAGKCYFSGREPALAKKMFVACSQWREAAECCYQLDQFGTAAEYY